VAALPLAAAPQPGVTAALQGVLRSAAGFPVADGKYGLLVNLYASPDAPAPLWSELHASVDVTAGLFSVQLGAVSPANPLPVSLFAEHTETFLGVQVIPDPAELPRTILSWAPIAVRATNATEADVADTAADLACAGCVQAQAVDFTYAGSLAKDGATFDLACTSCVTPARIAGAAIGSAAIAAGAVSSPHLQAGAVGGDALGAATVGAAALAPGSVDGGALGVAWALSDTAGGAALGAQDVACTGCVTAGAIAAGAVATLLPVASQAELGGVIVGGHLAVDGTGLLDVKDLDFLLISGGGLAGGLDVGGALALQGDWNMNGYQIKNFRVDTAAQSPTCDASTAGLVYLDTGSKRVRGCTGTAWVDFGVFPIGTQSNPAPTCKAILDAGDAGGSGTYWLDPNGGSTADAFQVECEMTTSGGGWSRLVPGVVSGLDGSAQKEYLYLYGSRWYRSPKTTLTWVFGSGKQLTGSYAYFNGSTTSAFTCNGSGETPQYGVGCSNGGGGTCKVLPIYQANASAATVMICQDCPNAFGGGVCQANVAVYVRY